ncbi:MAG: hypothetical protein JKY08_08040 [Flavobacteriaceae bacterium]|nr:hypothetical protein [Flavobacteriaceae bacterium]
MENRKRLKKGFKDVHKNKKNKKEAFELGVGAEAKTYVSITLGTSFGKGDNFDTDFYFSGVNLKIWLKVGFKKSKKMEKIIPEMKETFNILKNKGESK